MHEPLLAQAALPAPTSCLGLALRPFSLGHELYLIREQSPLISAQANDCTLSDLARAVLVCCSSWTELRAMPGDWLIGLKLRIWRRNIRRCDLRLHRAGFLAYLQDGSQEFPISEVIKSRSHDAPRTPGTPFLLRLQQWVMTHLRLTEAEAWDYPHGLAKMRWAAHWEQEGGLDIKNRHEEEFESYCADQDAKALARANN